MIFLLRIKTSFLTTKNLEVIFYEDFSIAQANRRRLTGVVTTGGSRNSSRGGTLMKLCGEHLVLTSATIEEAPVLLPAFNGDEQFNQWSG